MKYRTCVGIDTHSTKNEVFALDTETGEAWGATLSADPRELLGFLESIPADRGSSACFYEVGPPGSGSSGVYGWSSIVHSIDCVANRKTMQYIKLDKEWRQV